MKINDHIRNKDNHLDVKGKHIFARKFAVFIVYLYKKDELLQKANIRDFR